MLNRVQNFQIEKLLDEEIQKLSNNKNYFFSNYKNKINTDFSRNSEGNFNSSYTIFKTFNSSSNKYKKKAGRKKSFNKSIKIQENPKALLYCSKKNNNQSYKYLLTNNKAMKNKSDILNLGATNKFTKSQKIINGSIYKLKQNKSCSYIRKSNNKKPNVRKKSINKTNKSISKTTSKNKSIIKKHSYTLKNLLPNENWKNNYLKVKKELDGIKLKIKYCKRSNKQIGIRLEKIGKFEKNDRVEDKKINEMKKTYKIEKVKYELSENIRKKQKNLINNLAKEIENMKNCCNHLH